MGKNDVKQKGQIPLYWAAAIIAIIVCLLSTVIVAVVAWREIRSSDDLPTLLSKAETEPTIAITEREDSEGNIVRFSDQTYPQHISMNSLVQNVAGDVIDSKSLLVTTWSDQGEPAPDYAYLFDFVVTDSSERDRAELLELAYVLFRESFYNYSGPVVSVSLIIRASEIGEATNCFFSLAMGATSVEKYLPSEKPMNLERWLDELIADSNFGDAGISEQELVDANDPGRSPACKMRNWKFP